MITIVDFGMGNHGAVRNMLKKLGVASRLSSKAEDIASATKLILPGVGAFDNAMQNLASLSLIEVLHQRVRHDRVPVLGICLGMQLLSHRSEEGKLPGLGWIEAETILFSLKDKFPNLKIPHMGWSEIQPQRDSPILAGLEHDARFYFVHSYHVRCNNRADVVATATYGEPFTAIVQQEHIFGAQFHPEKSHRFGLQLLSNFVSFE